MHNIISIKRFQKRVMVPLKDVAGRRFINGERKSVKGVCHAGNNS